MRDLRNWSQNFLVPPSPPLLDLLCCGPPPPLTVPLSSSPVMLSGRRSLRFLASSQSARSFATHPALLFPRPPVAVLPKSSKKKDDSPKPRGVRIPSVVGGKSSITRDPLKFLKTINALLEDNNLEKALAFTRANTRGILTLPSWNRIIEYNLAAQNPTDALKAFNDVRTLDH